MSNSGIIDRLRNGGIRGIILSLDWPTALAITIAIYYKYGDSIMRYNLDNFVKNSSSLSGSLIAVILTGIAILVSLADEDFLSFIQDEGVYDTLMSSFEVTAILSLFVTTSGVYLLTVGISPDYFYVYLFFFLYLIFAIVLLISAIISFGEKMGQYQDIRNIPDDMGENIEFVHESELDDADDEK